MQKSLPELLQEQFGTEIPEFDNDAESVNILKIALSNHSHTKAAKNLLVLQFSQQLDQLQQENKLQQSNLQQLTQQGDVLAQCAAILGCVVPSSYEILTETLKLEAQIMQKRRKVQVLEQQFDDLRQGQLTLEGVQQFVEKQVEKASQRCRDGSAVEAAQILKAKAENMEEKCFKEQALAENILKGVVF